MATMKQVPDIKDHSGCWISTYCLDGNRYQTRASKLWYNLTTRTKNAYKEKFPTYSMVENGFNGFQEFASWCQEQTGYMERDGFNVFWALDKDILIKGNKIYSCDTCCFVPGEINSLLIKNDAIRGNLPIGVCFNNKTGKFQASLKSNGKNKNLGQYSSCDEAFSSYKVAKESHIKTVAEKWRSRLDLRVYNSLISWRVDIDD